MPVTEPEAEQAETTPEPDAIPEPEALAEPEPEPHPEPTPEAEGDTEPEKASEVEPTPDHDSRSKAEPEPAPDPEPDQESAKKTEDEQSQVPGFVEYTASDAPRYVFGAVFLAAAVAGILELLRAVQGKDAWPQALVLLFVAAAAGWALGRWAPKVVTLRDGTLEVTRAGNGDRFDLRDPQTQVDLGTNTRSPSWQARFSEPEGSRVTLRRNQVKVDQFVSVVQHHRAHLRDDAPAE